MRLRGTFVLGLVVAVGALVAAGGAAGAGSNLVPNPSFEGSLSGWTAFGAGIALASDGVDGHDAAKLTGSSAGNPYGVYTNAWEVGSTTAGTTYTGSAAFRSDTPGDQVCLRIREWTAGGAVVAYQDGCVTTTKDWQTAGGVTYTAQTTGGTLEAYVLDKTASGGSSYEVDAVTLTETSPPGPPPTAPPDTAIASGPASTTTDTSASFTFTSSPAGASFECSLDGAAFTACSSPQSYSGLTVATHTFQVRAVDASGNADPSPATATWTVESPPPPSGSNLVPNPSFEGSLAGWTAYGGSVSLASDGEDGKNAAKLTGGGSGAYGIYTNAWEVASTTAGATYTASAWFRSETPGDELCVRIREWTSAGTVVAFQDACVTSTSAWRRAPAVSYTTQRSGGTLEAYVFDKTATAGSSYEVDLVSLEPAGTSAAPPDTTITDGPSGTVASTSASFSFASTSSGATFACALDDAAFATCSSPQAYTGLAAGTHTFQVRAVDAAGTGDPSPASRTWTVQAASGDPTLLAAGDVAYCPGDPSASGAAQTAQLLGQHPGATIAVLGDGQYDTGTLAAYQSCYDKTWGAYRNRTRPAAGAHDYMSATPNGEGYFAYWGSTAGTAGQGWYSYDLGSWHVVVLNAPLCEYTCPSNDPQVQWLKSDLAAHPAQCTLAYFAYPLFTSGTEDGPTPTMKAFWTELYNAGADIVVNGHEHLYERFAPQTPNGALDTKRGIREFVAGTGGRGVYPFGKPAANSEVRYNGSFGVLQLTLHANGYDWSFLPVPGSTFTDSGSGTCH
jgi:hypothetical protein